jgi:pre-mRNA-splicing factor RBM22/SLT11
MASIKKDDVKQKWEETEFPLVCETCLGDNAYIRMTKESHGKKCKICENPFTVFAWQAGTKGRLKKVEICRTCAQAKNVCQVCIYDLQYGLPVKVRDKILRESGSGGGAGAIPQSNANRAWYTAQQERLLEQGQNAVGEANQLAHAQLQSMARMEPRYERNLAKLCSFFARGECNRGINCPFRHEMPKDRNDPMAKQNTKDRFYGTNDPVAGKLFARMKRKEDESRAAGAGHGDGTEDGFEQARSTLYVRFQGDGPWPPMTEEAIRDQFYSFGEIVSVRAQTDKGQAFVEYTQPEATELAIMSMNRKTLLDHIIHVSWARAPKRGNPANERKGSRDAESKDQQGDSTPTVIRPAPPPGGLSKAPIPKGLTVVKPPPAVAAIAAARRQQGASVSLLSSVPRPGGGPVRGVGLGAAKRAVGATQPYYASANPERLGTKSSKE